MSSTVLPGRVQTRQIAPLVGAVAFVVFYLAVDFAGAPLREGSLPMPDAPASEVYAYLTANGTASVVTGVLQLVSVGFLAIFVRGISRTTPGEQVGGSAGNVAGWGAVATMAISGLLTVLLGLLAQDLSLDTAVMVRNVAFYTGGAAHVVLLGTFLLLAVVRPDRWTRPVRVMACVGAIPAVLSIISVVWLPASVLLPLGRLLGMIALITAGVSLARGRSQPANRRW